MASESICSFELRVDSRLHMHSTPENIKEQLLIV